jgi:hypothetical protein
METYKQIDSSETHGLERHQLLMMTKTELKRVELITALASMLKSHALKLQQQK